MTADLTPQPRRDGGPLDGFASTEWSLILSASANCEDALERLCKAYWKPIYVYVRATGVKPVEAEDATQEFFAVMLRRDWLQQADPARGHFRGFLRSSVRQFLANRWRYSQAQKRRADRVVSFDAEEGERELAAMASPHADPSALYEQSWADCVLQTALARLALEENKTGIARFEKLRPFLTSSPASGDYARLAEELQIPQGQIAVLVHRLSRRFAGLIRAEVAATVRDPLEVDEELRNLLRLVSQKS